MMDKSQMKPVSVNRIPELDLLRGLALGGILLINVQVFSFSLALESEWAQAFSGFWDMVTVRASFVIAAQRFIGLFSLLFGIGIAIQKQLYEEAGISYISHFAKRTLALGLFGIINISFFFWGDVLLIYSLISVLLFCCFRLPNSVLLILAMLALLLPRLLLLDHTLELAFNTPKVLFGKQYPSPTLIHIYQSGSFQEMIQLRIKEFIAFNLTEPAWIRTAFAMMIVGYMIGRNNWHQTFLDYLPKSKMILFVLAPLCLGYIIFNLFYFIFFIPTPAFIILSSLFIAASLFVYIGIALWTFHFPAMQKLRIMISDLGRLSLSNYFLQQILCAFIFHHYGLGLFFKTSPVQNLAFVVLIYGIQLWLTHVYLKKYKNGPLEIIWRKLSK
jgi:uncharacterized protein